LQYQHGIIVQRDNSAHVLCTLLWLAVYHERVYRCFRYLSELLMTGPAGFGAAPVAISIIMVKVTVKPETAATNCSATEQAGYLQQPL
jgi:hypothetical protein